MNMTGSGMHEGLRIAFLSGFDLSHRKGGFDGLGGKIYDLVSGKKKDTILVDGINPKMGTWDRYWSRILRTLHLPAPFPAYTLDRLNRIRDEVESRHTADADLLLFHGVTPWVAHRDPRPYAAFTDCTFRTYMEYYHEPGHFSTSMLQKVCDRERDFMAGARKIFFTTQWALQEAKRQYGLDGSNLEVMGQGPTMSIPDDAFTDKAPSKQFVFIATDFLGKGGAEVCQAFQKLRTEIEGYRLLIIGQKPPVEYLEGPGVEYIGYINKSTPEGIRQFGDIYRNSKAILMLTRKDIFPLILIEGGLHGCPALANRQAAIPDIILEGMTGFLVGEKPEDLYDGMLRMARMEPAEELAMRRFTAGHYGNHYAWERIGERLLTSLGA